jgi:hypothetical protein
MTQIRLTQNEINYAYAVAQLRIDWADSAGAKHNYGLTPPDSLKAMKVGCIGEMALAKHLRIDWGHTQYNKNAYDVGGYEVRNMAPDPLGRTHASTVFYDPAKFVTPDGYVARSNLNPT